MICCYVYPNWQGSNSRGESNETLYSAVLGHCKLHCMSPSEVEITKNHFPSLKFPINCENYAICEHVQQNTAKMKTYFKTKLCHMPLISSVTRLFRLFELTQSCLPMKKIFKFMNYKAIIKQHHLVREVILSHR